MVFCAYASAPICEKNHVRERSKKAKKKAVKSLKLNGFSVCGAGAGIEPARLAAGDFESDSIPRVGNDCGAF